MDDFTFDELKRYEHAVHRSGAIWNLVHLGFDFDPSTSCILYATIKVQTSEEKIRTFRFQKPWLPQLNSLRLPEDFGEPITIIDIAHRGLESLKVLVVGAYEERNTYFLAENVEEIT